MSLSDRIAVMFDGHIMGERLPADTDEKELGLLMAGLREKRHEYQLDDHAAHASWAAARRFRSENSNFAEQEFSKIRNPNACKRMAKGATMDSMPRWADVFLTPLISLILAFFLSGLVVLYIGEESDRGAFDPDRRGSRISLCLGLYAVLRHQLHVHRAGRCRGLSRADVQHRRRRPGDAMGGLGVALVCADDPVAALDSGFARRSHFRRIVRRRLGSNPRLSASETWQPHRHHNDHVQLYRRGACLSIWWSKC